MKKLIIIALLLAPFLVKAEAPSGVFGFLDGKYYDSTQSLKYICFLDNNCYDISQVFAFKKQSVATIIPTIIESTPALAVTPVTSTPTTITPSNPIVPVIPKQSGEFKCKVYASIICNNSLDATVIVKSINFTMGRFGNPMVVTRIKVYDSDVTLREKIYGSDSPQWETFDFQLPEPIEVIPKTEKGIVTLQSPSYGITVNSATYTENGETKILEIH